MTATGNHHRDSLPATGNRHRDALSATGNRHRDALSATESRLRDALSTAAVTAVDVRPLTVPAHRSRVSFRIAVPALAVAVTVFGVVHLTTPAPPPAEGIIAMAMNGDEPSEYADVSVFLCKPRDLPPCDHAATREERAGLRRAIEARPEMERVLFEDRQRMWENFRRQNADNPTLMREIEVSDLPEAFRVWTRPGADPGAVARAMSELPGVSNSINMSCLLERASLWSIVRGFLPWSDEPEQCTFRGTG
ncbi:permease-like cell division protein FtsX [Streptosporangium sp. NPDC002524]|uniref:permease-like cell division protein FtsX n=1 Tax=Streptosporangium sp. NPDC002524 TaxID=3154537 RepID=UPI003318B750